MYYVHQTESNSFWWLVFGLVSFFWKPLSSFCDKIMYFLFTSQWSFLSVLLLSRLLLSLGYKLPHLSWSVMRQRNASVLLRWESYLTILVINISIHSPTVWGGARYNIYNELMKNVEPFDVHLTLRKWYFLLEIKLFIRNITMLHKKYLTVFFPYVYLLLL